MPIVSKKKLTPELTNGCLKLLCKKISKIGTASDMNNFLDVYFTPVEKNTILRRAAAIILLKNRTKYRDIENLLDTSKATISKTKQILSGDGYGKNLNKRVYSKSKLEEKKERKRFLRPYKGAKSII